MERHDLCLRTQGDDCVQRIGPAYDHRRLRVGKEIRQLVRALACLIAGIERKVDKAGTQAGEIERQRLPGLIDLHGHAVADVAAGRDQCVSDARGGSVEIVIADDRSAGNQHARLLRVLGKMIVQQRIQIGVHAWA